MNDKLKALKTVDAEIVAYLAIGANNAIAKIPADEDETDHFGTVSTVLEYEKVLSKIHEWITTNSEHPTMFLYEVVEEFGEQAATKIIKSEFVNVGEMLDKLMAKCGYSGKDRRGAFTFSLPNALPVAKPKKSPVQKTIEIRGCVSFNGDTVWASDDQKPEFYTAYIGHVGDFQAVYDNENLEVVRDYVINYVKFHGGIIDDKTVNNLTHVTMPNGVYVFDNGTYETLHEAHNSGKAYLTASEHRYRDFAELKDLILTTIDATNATDKGCGFICRFVLNNEVFEPSTIVAIGEALPFDNVSMKEIKDQIEFEKPKPVLKKYKVTWSVNIETENEDHAAQAALKIQRAENYDGDIPFMVQELDTMYNKPAIDVYL